MMVKDVSLAVKVSDVVVWPKRFCWKLRLNSVLLSLQSCFDSEESLVKTVSVWYRLRYHAERIKEGMETKQGR